MKIIKNKIGWICAFFAVITVLISSCNKEDDLGDPDRLFRPVITDESYGGTWIKVEWDKYEGTEMFYLDISVDSFATFVEQAQTDTTFYTFEDLEYDTKYFIRIKSEGSGLESEYFLNDIIKTSDVNTKLNPIGDEDVIDNMVKVSWEEVIYDSLVVYPDDATANRVTQVLSDEDNENKEIVIRGLTPDMGYKVKAFYSGEYKGKRSFTTLESQIFEGDVLDLRNYTEDESYSILTQGFFDTLAIDYPEGVTIVLAGGTHYELGGGRQVTSSFSMVTGYSLSGNAIIEVAGNFDLPADAVVGSIHLEKLRFTDHEDKPRTESNYGGTYLINISGSGSSLDEFSIESCDIRYKRGVCRVKTGATVKAVSINNCIIDSIAGYGIVNLDNSGIIANSVSVTNTTISNTELFLRNDKMTTALGSMIVTNVTTYNVPKSYFFRMGTIENVDLSSCLFGMNWDPENGCEGLRYNEITNSSITNNYRTSDCNWALIYDEGGNVTGEKNPIESEQLSTNSDETFADPSKLDFTVTDSKLVDKVGDPRWW